MQTPNPPTILLIGATGNTGRGVTTTLPSLLRTSTNHSTHRILALTRSLTSAASQSLLANPAIQVLEHPWPELTTSWLRTHNVTRIFIAPHINTTLFAEESALLIAALHADVEYIVRVSTSAPNVRPDSPVYYARMHWAIENMLCSKAFARSRMHWTSLQPNAFAPFFLSAAAGYINEFRSTGSQDSLALRLMAAEDVGSAIIDPGEVGVFAAHLLACPETAVHHGKKYVFNGPVDITGKEIVGLVGEVIGEAVRKENVVYQDMSVVDEVILAMTSESRNVVGSIRYAMEASWRGECRVETTSPEVREIAPARKTPGEVLRELVDGEENGRAGGLGKAPGMPSLY
ncbi:NmrA-like family protein [Aspergillus mulundensis]|uniref:NmrA-like domain-containing protein n=1 Tax=Aspergillus mulundensis TaxID=1810919 RepID=A0A3D8R8Z6_9EURO|nr:hypothetical protein DSM5745_08043 [Aspergillus mulundensis]RDW70532.1 hypothetical protein DSM5745_08043 [Aspergillus mulundensis]